MVLLLCCTRWFYINFDYVTVNGWNPKEWSFRRKLLFFQVKNCQISTLVVFHVIGGLGYLPYRQEHQTVLVHQVHPITGEESRQ